MVLALDGPRPPPGITSTIGDRGGGVRRVSASPRSARATASTRKAQGPTMPARYAPDRVTSGTSEHRFHRPASKRYAMAAARRSMPPAWRYDLPDLFIGGRPTGTFQLFHFGVSFGGPAYWWSWPMVFTGQLMVALCFCELAGRYPVAGSVHNWSKRMGGPHIGRLAGRMMTTATMVSPAAVARAHQLTLPQISSPPPDPRLRVRGHPQPAGGGRVRDAGPHHRRPVHHHHGDRREVHRHDEGGRKGVDLRPRSARRPRMPRTIPSQDLPPTCPEQTLPCQLRAFQSGLSTYASGVTSGLLAPDGQPPGG